MRKLKMIGLPVLFILLAMVLVYVHHVQEQLKAPSPNWSRAIPITKAEQHTNIEVVNVNNGYELYIPNNSKVSEITLNETLEKVEEKDISVNVPKDSPLWADENGNMVYIREGNLYLFNKEEKLLQANVNGMNSLSNKIVYWSGKKLFELSTKDFKTKSVLTIKNNIGDVSIAENSDSFIISSIPKEKYIVLEYYFLGKQKQYKNITLMEPIDENLLHFIGSSFVEEGNITHVIYSTLSLSNGNKALANNYAAFDPSKVEEIPSFKTVSFHTEEGGRYIRTDKEVKITLDNGPKLWFVASDQLTRRDDAVNVFEAHLTKDDRWIASMRSRTYQVSHIPFYISKDTIFWKDFNPGSNFDIILAASQNADVIQKASHYTEDDLAHASSDTIISFTGGVFIVLLFGLLWLALPIILVFFLPENLMENKPTTVNISIMGLFVLLQIALSHWMLGNQFHYFAPAYLTFKGASIIVFIVIAIISWLLTRSVRNKEWGNIKEVSYFMAVDIVLSMFVMGPYVL